MWGWLKEVNWHRHTAQLHQSVGPYIKLRFDADLDEEMRQLATRFVEIRGHGTFRDDDQWRSIQVEEIRPDRSWREPFDLDGLLNDPNLKVFDPDSIAPINLTEEEWETFDRAILSGRGVR